MTFVNLRTKEITISRLQTVSGTMKKSMTTVTADYANIQPASTKKSLEVTGAVGKLYELYVDVNLDIQDGDRIKDDDGIEYEITAGGVNNFDFGLMVQHKEVLAIKITND